MTGRGIRFIVVDPDDIKDIDPKRRARYRKDIYAMMLVARKVTEKDIAENTSVYRTLSFFLNSHYQDGTKDIAGYYIEALIKGNIALLINSILSYNPAERWETPDYEKVAATLLSA